MGMFATRYATSLSPEQRLQIRNFYFGGLDYHRLAVNSDHNQTLVPPKHAIRSDDVDFQRGEVEWGEHNLYFDRYSYHLAADDLKPPSARPPAAQPPASVRF
jgi:hypothetical protein